MILVSQFCKRSNSMDLLCDSTGTMMQMQLGWFNLGRSAHWDLPVLLHAEGCNFGALHGMLFQPTPTGWTSKRVSSL